MASQRLTFYLMREDVDEFEDALDTEKPSVALSIAESASIDGRFYYVPPRPKVPKWIPFIRPILSADLEDIRSATTSGLLLLRSNKRMFALTFGYGRSLLNLSKIEFQFGLRVALNRIDPRQLRSLDTKTFDDIVIATNTQASKSAELPTFGVDVSTDILRAATGEPRDTSVTKRLSGSDALVMNVETDPTDLPALCDDLLTAFSEEHYKSDFGWIDHLALVRDATLADALNACLVEDLNGGMATTTHLAMPENIGWEEINAFRIGGTRDHEYDDLDLETYLTQLNSGGFTVEKLFSRRVSVRFSRSDDFDSRWSLYKCIVSEQHVDGTLYVLIEGRWFAVSETLVQEVDLFASRLREPTTTLIPARPGEIETDYNDRLSTPSGMLKLDARIKRVGGAASGIELCDVLSEHGEFIHVKRKSQSSTLSHLFAQGTVSATAFVDDGSFRDQFRSEIERLVPDDDKERWLRLIPGRDAVLDRSQYCVTYAVVANSKRDGTDWLPFFSKLNLMQHGRLVQNLGFDVRIGRVPII